MESNNDKFFYITEDELNARSYDPRLRGKPLAWVFYVMMSELGFKGNFNCSKVQNFLNRCSDKNGAFEIIFSDSSSIVYAGEIRIYHSLSNFFERISFSEP